MFGRTARGSLFILPRSPPESNWGRNKKADHGGALNRAVVGLFYWKVARVLAGAPAL